MERRALATVVDQWVSKMTMIERWP